MHMVKKDILAQKHAKRKCNQQKENVINRELAVANSRFFLNS